MIRVKEYALSGGTMRRRIAAAVIVAAGLATAGIAYAESQPADPSAGPNPPAAVKAGPRPGGPGVLKGAIHGDLLIRAEDGATRTVTFDRGRITAISAGSITIERPDGVSVSKNLTDQTAFNGTPKDQLQAGMRVAVVSAGDAAERVISKGARAENRQERQAKRQDRLERRKERLEQRRGDLKPSSAVDDGLETILS
jgi:hypothetical protein